MAKIWANKLIMGRATWQDVPFARKEAVIEILQGIALDDDDPYHERAQELLDEINGEE